MTGEARIFGIAGWSGSGKTTLMVRLLPELIGRGLSVSTIKHAHHSFDIDTPGKDSYEHRMAGATEVMVSSSARWALVREGRGAVEPTLEELIGRMAAVDLLLIEGFKSGRYDKLEVHRRSANKPLLCSDDADVVAVASDEPLTGLRVPVLGLDDVVGIADFILRHCGITGAANVPNARGAA